MKKEYIEERMTEINASSDFNPNYPNTIEIDQSGIAYSVTLAELKRGQVILETHYKKSKLEKDSESFFSDFSNESGIAAGKNLLVKLEDLPWKARKIFQSGQNLLGQKNEFFKNFQIVYSD